MEENLILDKLVQFGLTRQEANIYLCLYQNGELTGYEVAKMTGISRSNVYGGLSDLTDKGAAFLVQGSSNRYVAASIEEFCDHKVKDLQNARTYLCEHIPEVKKSSTGYITVEGYTNIRIDRLELHAQLFIFVPAIDHRLLHTILPVLLLQFPIEKITGSGDEPGFQVGHIEKG